jgi:hypothetical protein
LPIYGKEGVIGMNETKDALKREPMRKAALMATKPSSTS